MYMTDIQIDIQIIFEYSYRKIAPFAENSYRKMVIISENSYRISFIPELAASNYSGI